MIKAINISPINTSNKLIFECDNCRMKGIISLGNSIVNTNDKGEIIESVEDYVCQRCGQTMNHSHTPGFTCLGIISDIYDVAYNYTYEIAGNVYSLNIAVRDKDSRYLSQHSLLHYDLYRLGWATVKGFSESEAIAQFQDSNGKKEVEKYMLSEVEKRLQADMENFQNGNLKDGDRISI